MPTELLLAAKTHVDDVVRELSMVESEADSTDEGLPQAVQVIGPQSREDLCLDAAAAIEDRLGILTPIDPR